MTKSSRVTDGNYQNFYIYLKGLFICYSSINFILCMLECFLLHFFLCVCVCVLLTVCLCSACVCVCVSLFHYAASLLSCLPRITFVHKQTSHHGWMCALYAPTRGGKILLFPFFPIRAIDSKHHTTGRHPVPSPQQQNVNMNWKYYCLVNILYIY